MEIKHCDSTPIGWRDGNEETSKEASNEESPGLYLLR